MQGNANDSANDNTWKVTNNNDKDNKSMKNRSRPQMDIKKDFILNVNNSDNHYKIIRMITNRFLP